MHFQCFIWSTQPLPCLGSCCRHRDCLSLARWRKECKILGIGLEFGTQKFTRCVLGKENFSMCLIGCWCLFGFPQPQKSLIPSTEWMWRLSVQRASKFRAQRRTKNITPERPDGLYATWSCSPESPCLVRNCISELCSWRIPSFEVQVGMENMPCWLPLCSECNVSLGDRN